MYSNESHTAPVQAPVSTIGQCVSDGVLMARLRALLRDDPVTCDYVIQVETFNGAVILSGYVECQSVRRRAIELASSIGGCGPVKDVMEVREI